MIRNNDGLTIERIRQIAPSVFAEAPAGKCSARYTQIPTIKVVEGMISVGWLPVGADQTRVRLPEGRDFAKHQIRLRHQSGLGAQVGDSVPEIVLTNSHDGSSSYRLTAGLYRLACSNGLVVGGEAIQEQRVRHSGDIVAEVIGGATNILDQFGRIIESRDQMRSLNLSRDEHMAFAIGAAHLKFEDLAGELTVEPQRLLTVRRNEDRAPDLWTTYNIVQENMMRGGLLTKKGNRTRQVRSIDADTKLNKALWVMAEQMMTLKA